MLKDITKIVFFAVADEAYLCTIKPISKNLLAISHTDVPKLDLSFESNTI